jgi:hypothetical protein
METIFDFAISDNEYTYNISSNTKLCIKRYSKWVAMLYFTDEMNNKINIPNDTIVYTFEWKTNNKIIYNAVRNDYVLYSTDNYVVELSKNLLIDIKTKRRCEIES